MIDKIDFVRYVEIYQDFEKYLNELADVKVNVWKDDRCGWFRDAYVALVCHAMDISIDDKYPNDIEMYLFENRCFDSPGALYDWLNPPNKDNKKNK